ncbi:MAG: tetratricopeptide repeat protein [Desulfobulbus sp.]|jgi:Tfp pilus assembly protein PilF
MTRLGHRLRLVLLVLLLLLPTACADKKTSPAGPPLSPPPTEVPPEKTGKAGPATPNHLALARDLVRQGHYEVALNQLITAMEHDSTDPEIFHLMGVCYRETGKNKEGEEALRRALRLDATHAGAWDALGMVLQNQGRQDEAIDAFRQAVSHDPARAELLNNLGYALLRAEQKDEAYQTLQRALTLDPALARARNNLALCALRRNNDHEALRILLAGNPEWAAYHNMAVLYQQIGRQDQAIIMRRKAREHRQDMAGTGKGKAPAAAVDGRAAGAPPPTQATQAPDPGR